MPSRSDIDAGERIDSGDIVPMATCVFAAALWVGCALASGSRWSGIAWAGCAEIMRDACVPAAAIGSLGAAVTALRAWRHRIRTAAGLSCALALLAGSALLLGVALRFEQTVEASCRPRLDLPSDGRLVRFEATLAAPFAERGFAVDLLSHHLERPSRFAGLVVDVELIDERGIRHPLGDPSAVLSVSVLGAAPECRVAERITFVGVARSMSSRGLPGDARMIEASLRRGVVGSVAVDSPELVRIVEARDGGSPLSRAAAQLRDSIRERVRAALLEGVPADGDVAIRAMLVALVLGDAEDGYRTIENSFRAVGLSHILAISGFNLAVLGWIVGLVARAVSSDPKVHALACGVAAVGALILMAPAASATRAALMAAVGASGHSLGRDWNGDAVLALAAVAMLVASPSDAVGPGFQLSFACVIALRHLAGPIQRRWLFWMPSDDPRRGHPAWLGLAGEFVARATASGLAAFVASVPIVLCHFGTLQPYGTALTLLCAPLSTATLAIAYPKAILAAAWPPLLGFLGWPLHLAAWLQVELVEFAIRCGAGSLAVGGIHWSIGAATGLASVVALRASRRVMRTAAWLALAVLLALPPIVRGIDREVPHFEATMFAIGDGTAIAIESGSSLVLFDGGSSSIGNVASRALLPWIDERGGVVEAVIISHPDLDHLSALADVARYARVGCAYLHESMLVAERSNPAVRELLASFRARGTRIETLAAGDSLRIGHAAWTVLWPRAEFRSRRDNDMSLVVSVEVDASEGVQRPRLLLCGDIETEPAARLSAMHERGEVDLSCDVLELPHHGSWREAVAGALALAQPQLILQSTAARRFSQDRFEPHLPEGSMRLATCRDGTIRVSFFPDGVIRASVVDESAAGGMRPVGRMSVRRRPRRFRIRWPRSALPDEACAVHHDPIAADAVAAILDDDLQTSIAFDPTAESNGSSPCARVEDERLDRRFAESQCDRDTRIRRCGFGERDLGCECDLRTRERHRQPEHGVHRAVELNRAKPKQRLLRWLDAGFRASRIAIRRLGRSILGRSARHKRCHRLPVEEERGWPCHRACERLWVALRSKIRIREEEPPSGLGVERDILRANDRSIGGPEKRICGPRLFKGGERDGGDSIELDAPESGCLWRRIGSALNGGRLRGCLIRLGLTARRLEENLLADGLDEAEDDIAVLKKDGIGVGTRRCASGRHEPELGDQVGLDRNRANPTMLPTGLPEIRPKRARKQLAIPEDERASAHLREECHGPVGIGADEACDDLVGLDLAGSGIRCGAHARQREAVDTDLIHLAVDPPAVAKKHLQPNAAGRVRGLGRSARRNGNRRSKQRRKRERGCSARKVDEVGQHSHRRYRVVLALEDRQVALWHLKHDEGHRGAVGVALGIRPRAVGILLRKQLVANGRPPALPTIAAREVHRLHRVVVTVEVVGLREAAGKAAAASREGRLLEIVEAALDRLILVDAGVEQTRDTRGRARPRRTSKVLHVAESAVGVLAGTDIADRIVDRRLRHLDAGIPRAAKRHDLADGDRHIRVVGDRVVSPAAFVVLAADDQLHRTHKRVANPIILLVHAVDLAKEERRESVAVHRAVRLIRDQQAGLGRMVEDEVERLLHALAELTAARKVAIRHERDRAEARHADMLAKSALTKRTIGLLLATQVLESLADSLLKTRCDLRLARSVLRAHLRRSSRRGNRGLTWVRGHWRRTRRGRSRLNGVGGERVAKGRRGHSRSQSLETRKQQVGVVVKLTLTIIEIRLKSGGARRADDDRSSVEGRPKGSSFPIWLIRMARAPPCWRGGGSEAERWRDERRQRAEAERCTQYPTMVHFEASSASRR